MIMNTQRKNRISLWGISFAICLLSIGYVTYSQNTNPVIIEVPDHKDFSSDFDSFILEHNFLALETSPECIMPGHPGAIHFHKDRIFVCYPRDGLFSFARDGKFISHVKPKGKGHYNLSFENGWDKLEATPYGPFLGYPGCDTIYSIAGNKSRPAYILDYGKITAY